ncbi:MAG: ABC transporter ATP-binding protein [Clostridia bacterium]|nr:ABC transporter ATP-binding protein [Clostridia bacterium]
MKVLQFKNVCLNYYSDKGETVALENVNFDVNEGEFVSIVGPSGCGKTTILSLISKLLTPTKGNILLNGVDITQINKDTKDNFIGYMFQKDQLFEWRTIFKNVTLGLEITHQNTQENIEYANTLLKKYGLWEFKDKHPHELSGGMRQRVALIRTLVLHPKIMLLDEAFSALDFQTRINVCDDIHTILKQENITSILVTHDITEAITMSDKIIVLSNRPAHVKNIHKMNFDKSLTPLKRRESENVSKYFDIIWKELNNEKQGI